MKTLFAVAVIWFVFAAILFASMKFMERNGIKWTAKHPYLRVWFWPVILIYRAMFDRKQAMKDAKNGGLMAVKYLHW